MCRVGVGRRAIPGSLAEPKADPVLAGRTVNSPTLETQHYVEG
jgi:hypothetical protein